MCVRKRRHSFLDREADLVVGGKEDLGSGGYWFLVEKLKNTSE